VNKNHKVELQILNPDFLSKSLRKKDGLVRIGDILEVDGWTIYPDGYIRLDIYFLNEGELEAISAAEINFSEIFHNTLELIEDELLENKWSDFSKLKFLREIGCLE